MEVLEAHDLTRSLRACRSADRRHHHTGSRHIERPTAKARTGIVHERLVAVGSSGSKRMTRPLVATRKVFGSALPFGVLVGLEHPILLGPNSGSFDNRILTREGAGFTLRQTKIVFDLLESTALFQM